MLGIVYSVKDPAGSGIAKYLLSELKPVESNVCRGSITCFTGDTFVLGGFSEDVIFFDFLDERLPQNIEFYLVLSRHSSESRIKSYTVHATGNFSDEALAGGRPRELGIAHPLVEWFLLRALYKLSRDFPGRSNYEVSYEATHHGPTNLSKPVVFIEIGSSLEEWVDSMNHSVIGESVKLLINAYSSIPSCRVCIGVGGGHYPRKHTELALNQDYCYGHIASKHVLDYINMETLMKMKEKTCGEVNYVIVEKKGTRLEQRKLIENYARANNLTLKYI
jgi:D-aminoacyl-tRNA deacylase